MKGELAAADIASGSGKRIPAPPQIDFVTARKEFYKRPTALPDVEPGSIKLDLHRRDFTINTLAVRAAVVRGAGAGCLDAGRAEERDRRHPEGDAEKAGAAVGGDEQS